MEEKNESVAEHSWRISQSDLKAWSENEYSLNLTYADDKVEFSSYLKELREAIRKDTIEKLEEN